MCRNTGVLHVEIQVYYMCGRYMCDTPVYHMHFYTCVGYTCVLHVKHVYYMCFTHVWSPMVQYEPLVIKIYKCNENVKTRSDNKKTYHCHCHCHCMYYQITGV